MNRSSSETTPQMLWDIAQIEQLKARYFRVGHMNVVGPSDVLATVGAVERALLRAGHQGEPGRAVAAAQAVLAAR